MGGSRRERGGGILHPSCCFVSYNYVYLQCLTAPPFPPGVRHVPPVPHLLPWPLSSQPLPQLYWPQSALCWCRLLSASATQSSHLEELRQEPGEGQEYEEVDGGGGCVAVSDPTYMEVDGGGGRETTFKLKENEAYASTIHKI